jgi:coenzyme F420-reducing hydrogenase delta subunit
VIHLLKAIEAGADGVMIVGCLEGDCSFMTGNLWARKVVGRVKQMLAEMHIEPERVEMFNIPGPNGAGFAAAATEFTERIRQLGPSPVKHAGADPERAAREALGDAALPATGG